MIWLTTLILCRVVVSFLGFATLSQHVVTHMSLCKITVSSGLVNSRISLPEAISYISTLA